MKIRAVIALVAFGLASNAAPLFARPPSAKAPTTSPAHVGTRLSPAQTPPARFWIAGRYDSTRVIVYFNTVKFRNTLESVGRKIAEPVAGGFFAPVAVPAAYSARFQRAPGNERFAVGDKYDMLLGGGRVATITVAQLVGVETDEGSGNDSYLGAVCRLAQGDVQWLTKNYYVVRRHRGSDNAGTAETPATSRVVASLRDTVMPAAMRQDVSSHLHDLLLRDTSETIREDAAQIPVAVNDVKTLVLAGGALRFYVRAVMQSDTSCTKVEAWITPGPVLRIAAMAASTCMYDSLKEPGRLVDVYDLGDGRTGLIVDYDLPDGRALELIEYRDGVVLAHMPTLQSISASA